MSTDTSPLDDSRVGDEPISPRQAVQVMVRVQRYRRDAIEEYVRLGQAAAAKKRDAVKAKAEAQLKSRQNTVEDRKADAALKSADAVFEADVAEVLVNACEKSMWVLRDDWDTCRSAGANERAERNATEGFGS